MGWLRVTLQYFVLVKPWLQHLNVTMVCMCCIIQVYSGAHGRTMIFTRTKAEANELALSSSLKQDSQVSSFCLIQIPHTLYFMYMCVHVGIDLALWDMGKGDTYILILLYTCTCINITCLKEPRGYSIMIFCRCTVELMVVR